MAGALYKNQLTSGFHMHLPVFLFHVEYS